MSRKQHECAKMKNKIAHLKNETIDYQGFQEVFAKEVNKKLVVGRKIYYMER